MIKRVGLVMATGQGAIRDHSASSVGGDLHRVWVEICIECAGIGDRLVRHSGQVLLYDMHFAWLD